MAEDTAGKERKNVYITLHKSFVHENIKYTDRSTGEQKSFNVARLPSDTVIDGRDVGGCEFSPLYVNPSRFRGENWRDIPLLADREVQLRRDVRDIEGNPIVGEGGRREKEVIRVMPEQALRRGACQRRPRARRARGCRKRRLGIHGEGRAAPFRP